MAGIKSLAKDTAIYGLSSIIGRFLNWCLVPLYTIVFAPAEYGVVTFVYSVVALAMVVLTYGMETGFFRFANHERWTDANTVYSTSLISLATSSSLFVLAVMLFLRPISGWMECPDHPEYIALMAVCVALDAFLAMPFSYLRYRKRPIRFALVRLVNIGVNIGLNLFFILLCPWLLKVAPGTVSWWYVADFGIGYIFLANLIASVVNMVMMIPELRGFKWRFNGRLWREMMLYSAPLLVLGVAGIMNQTIDKILLPKLITDQARALYELGIYGANYKVAIIMVMFLQAFRFAYEPFIFAQAKERGEKSYQAYRDAMKFFVIFAVVIFLGVMFYLDVLRYIISPKYFSGLKVVPIVMLAEVFFGIFFNLSLWYKLSDRTVWGMWFSLLGLAVTVVLNVLLVPSMGYMGCAIAALCSYGVMMVTSYFVGLKLHPIGYPMGRLLGYMGIGAACFAVGYWLVAPLPAVLVYAVRTAIILGYLYVVVRVEKMPLPGPLAKLVR